MFERLRSRIELSHEYRLERMISSSDGKVLYRLIGSALFEPLPSGTLRYSERVLNGNLVGTRSYLYRFRGDTLEIFFDEMPERLFVALPNRTTHRCGEDIYQVSMEPCWPMTMKVTVNGPSKDYVIVSRLL